MELGKKIEQLRLEKGLSRPDFCGDESELTVRQLARIESGQSQPSIPKLEYIAQRLGIPAYSLMPDYKELPQGYLELKYKLLREPIYNKVEVLDKKELQLEDLYNRYYEELPLDEQRVYSVLQATIDTTSSRNPEFASAILDEYLPSLATKTVYTINEILLIRLFFFQLLERKDIYQYGQKIDLFMLRLVEQFKITRQEDYFIVRDVLFSGLCCLEMIEHYDYFDTYLECLQDVMEATEDYQKKPLVLMLIWKQLLRKTQDFSAAEPMFQSAKTFAKIIGNDHLAQKLTEEWQEDLKKYL
ncbi:helix-turn-helix domain-containing protein [Streptococcus suis]|uniref:helix-turn-helix domain-containing protein n=1 Tax=Streptococcus suis TaxID=1307 RepID=UPI002FC8D756